MRAGSSAVTIVVLPPGAGGQALAARLDTPSAQAPRAYVLFAHCFTCSKDTRATSMIAEALASVEPFTVEAVDATTAQQWCDHLVQAVESL